MITKQWINMKRRTRAKKLLPNTKEGIATKNDSQSKKLDILPLTTQTLVALLYPKHALEVTLHAWIFFYFVDSIWTTHMKVRLNALLVDNSLSVFEDDETTVSDI